MKLTKGGGWGTYWILHFCYIQFLDGTDSVIYVKLSFSKQYLWMEKSLKMLSLVHIYPPVSSVHRQVGLSERPAVKLQAVGVLGRELGPY